MPEDMPELPPDEMSDEAPELAPGDMPLDAPEELPPPELLMPDDPVLDGVCELVYKQEGLCVGRHKPRRGRHRSAMTRPAQTKATRVNESWSMDFMADQLFDGRTFQLRTLVDDLARESLTIDLDQRLTGERVAAILDGVARDRGLPEKIRVDNGSSLSARCWIHGRTYTRCGWASAAAESPRRMG